jgi:hypothetical protein
MHVHCTQIYVLYNLTQLVLMNCTFVCTTHINGTHKHTHGHCTLYIFTDILYYCTHLVQMGCMCVYTTIHCCTTWHYLKTHLWCTHYAWISYTNVHLYCRHVSVHSGTVLLCVYTTALYNCTLASASLSSVLSTNNRRASIYLLCSD